MTTSNASNIHILMVSAQAAPNLLPTLDPALKPSEVVLIVTGSMKNRAQNLESVLKESGIRVQQVMLHNESDFSALQDQFIDLATRYEGHNIILNATGGTKLMSLVAYEVARAQDWRVVYLDMDSGEIVWLTDKDVRQKLNNQLRLTHYLKGYGFNCVPDTGKLIPLIVKRQTLLNEMIARVGSISEVLGRLNFAAQSNPSSLSAKLDDGTIQDKNFNYLLSILEKGGVLNFDPKSNIITFFDHAAKDFATGAWLEAYVYQTLSRFKSTLNIQDHKVNLEVLDKGGVKNEFDVIFLAKNSLYIVECKTARMSGKNSKANDALFKLSELCRRVGGTGAKGMFVSYRPLNPSEKKLAEALNIFVVEHKNLQRLDEHFKKWVGTR